MGWISDTWQAWRRSRLEKKRKGLRPTPTRSGERKKRASEPEMAACLFCGRIGATRIMTSTVQLDCLNCGSCEVTVEAMGLLRGDERLRAPVLRQIRRHLDTGAARPLVDVALIQSLKGR